MIALRPFSAADWQGLAGAESFPDGSEPLLGTICVHVQVPGVVGIEEIAAEVVLDASGLAIQAYSEDGDVLFVVVFGAPFSARAVALLNDCVSLSVLGAMPGADFQSWCDEFAPLVRAAS